MQSAEARTLDHSPPPPGYLPTSGGLFRDCSIHDFDVLRFVTGREVVSAFAVGAVRGDERFAAAADIATGAALLTLDDDTLVTVTASRYNGGGHDVRLEVHGSLGTIGVGYDETLAVTSAEAGVDWPRGPRVTTFMERFRRAYRAELAAFTEVVAGKPSPCTVEDALAAFRVAEACERSRATGRPVALAEIGVG